MVRPAYRSRSLRRIKVRTPGGELKVHYEKRFRNPPRCAICGRVLSGVNEKRVKTDHEPVRSVSRPYGGYVCHECLRLGLKLAVRLSSGRAGT